jgi:molecular chaperone GrpE
MNEEQIPVETANESMETITAEVSAPSETENTTEVEVMPENLEDLSSQAEKPTESTESNPSIAPEEAIAALQQKIANQQQEIAQQTEELDGYKKRYITLAAEFDNYRKRTQREQKELEQQVKRKTIVELLSVVDNFERARTQLKPSSDGEMEIHKSYQSVYKSFADSLKRLGVSPMRPEGQLFDPNYHEAMLREYTNDHPEGTVLEELVRGYLLGDQVLRHSMVKVAAPQENVTSAEEEAAESPENNDS